MSALKAPVVVVQQESHKDVHLWYVDQFELKATETWHTQKKLTSPTNNLNWGL